MVVVGAVVVGAAAVVVVVTATVVGTGVAVVVVVMVGVAGVGGDALAVVAVGVAVVAVGGASSAVVGAAAGEAAGSAGAGAGSSVVSSSGVLTGTVRRMVVGLTAGGSSRRVAATASVTATACAEVVGGPGATVRGAVVTPGEATRAKVGGVVLGAGNGAGRLDSAPSQVAISVRSVTISAAITHLATLRRVAISPPVCTVPVWHRAHHQPPS